MPQKAYFVIADITGYTAFLTGSELEHAQDILKSLFNSLLDNIKPPMTISNFQGDAILMYAPAGSFIQGQTLLEAVENLYCEFTQTKEHMHHNTTCTCQACSNIPKLDLKMFVHHGEYVIQDMRGKAELSGPDVIIVHRMMKNNVKEQTGLQAYTLFSEAAIKGLGLEEFTCEMKPHQESYEHIGDVKMFAYCLKTMWEREREKRRVFVEPTEAMILVEVEVPAPPALVWDYLNEPQRAVQWMEVQAMSLVGAKNGRRGVGATVHCVHGKNESTDMMIEDWRPFDYVTHALILPMKVHSRYTTRLTPTAEGTRVTFMIAHPWGKNGMSKFIAKRIMPLMVKSELTKIFTGNSQRLREMISGDIAAGKVAGTPSLN